MKTPVKRWSGKSVSEVRHSAPHTIYIKFTDGETVKVDFTGMKLPGKLARLLDPVYLAKVAKGDGLVVFPDFDLDPDELYEISEPVGIEEFHSAG